MKRPSVRDFDNDKEMGISEYQGYLKACFDWEKWLPDNNEIRKIMYSHKSLIERAILISKRLGVSK